MSGLPDRLTHDHDKFVDRITEVRLVLDLVQRLLLGEPSDRRTVIFHGQRGAGKSWLLREIAFRLANKESGLTLYLDLADFTGQEPHDAIQTVIQRVHQPVAETIGSAAVSLHATNDLDQLAEWLVADVKQMPGALVVLLDHVDESHKALLEALEDHLLGPLVGVPEVLLILAGRGKEYIWKGPELRIRSQECDLRHFEPSDTQEQLEKQVPQPTPPADEIQQLSGGYPWSNYILGVNRDDRIAALEQCITNLIGDWLNRSDPPADRACLDALCVLRAFSDAMIPFMLGAYSDDSVYQTWEYRRYRQIRQSLLQTTLAKWDEPSGGYVIDQALRRVLEHWLYEKHREVWTRLHTAARDLFDEWASKYPRTAARWRKETTYHDGKLAHGPSWSLENQEEEEK